MTTDTRARAAVAAVLARTSTGGRPLIALDHDGTLAPIAATPAGARLAPGAAEAIARLAEVAEVAVVSGRGLEDLRQRLEGLGATLVAEHGLRALTVDGEIHLLATPLDAGLVEGVVAELAELLRPHPGWIVEDKGVGVAVHHRTAQGSDVPAVLDEVRRLLEQAARATGGELQAGKAVLELRAGGADKGRALRWLAERTGGAPVVMVGDDLTDLPALALAESLGGVGILVDEGRAGGGVGDDHPGGATVVLAGPDEVVAALRLLASALAART